MILMFRKNVHGVSTIPPPPRAETIFAMMAARLRYRACVDDAVFASFARFKTNQRKECIIFVVVESLAIFRFVRREETEVRGNYANSKDTEKRDVTLLRMVVNDESERNEDGCLFSFFLE